MFPSSESKIHHVSKRLLLVFLFVAALLSLGGRVLLSQVEYFKSEIELELAGYGITGVTLDSVKGSWQGLHPLLKIQGASLSIPGRSQALSINQLDLSVNLISSLWNGELKVRSLHSRIEKLILVRDESAQWWLNDIPLSNTQGDERSLDIYTFFDQLPDYVSIDIRLLQIRDLYKNEEYLIQQTGLHSSSKGEYLFLSLSANLPEVLGEKLELNLIGNAQYQQLYLKVDNLGLASLMQLMDIKTPGLDDARLSLQSWITMSQYQPRQLINKAQFSHVQVSHIEQLQQADTEKQQDQQQEIRFKLLQKALFLGGDWQIDSEITDIHRGQSNLPGFNTQLIVDPQNSKSVFWIDTIDVKSLMILLSDVLGNEPSFELLKQMSPKATVENMVAELDLNEIKKSTFGFAFHNLYSQRAGQIPSISGLNGQVLSVHRKGQMTLSSSRLAMDFGKLFRLPVKLDTFTASIRFAEIGDQWLVQADEFNLANSDIKLQGRAWLEIPRQGLPFLSLRAGYQDGNAASTSRYLPVSIMPETTVAWLDSSLHGGDIVTGDILFHGRLEKLSLLQQKQSGEFHALFDAENPQLDIYGGWPSLTRGKGVVSFHNTEMDISLSQVLFAASEVDRVHVKIPDLMHAELFINAKTAASADDLLETLSALPVLNVFDTVQKQTRQIAGLVDVDLDLMIPLTKDSNNETSVKAQAGLHNLELSIPEWKVEFDQLNGVLDIDNENVRSDTMRGRYRSEPIKLQISSDINNKTTDFEMQGNLQTNKLMTGLPDFLVQPISGKSDWLVRVSVPTDKTIDLKGVRLIAASDLVGTRLDFPNPVFLDTEETGRIVSEVIIKPDQLDFSVTLKDCLTSVGKLHINTQGEYRLQSMNFVFGDSGKAEIPQQGIELSGVIDTLDTDGWLDYIATYSQPAEAGSSPVLEQVKRVDLEVKNLKFGSQNSRDAQIVMTNQSGYLPGSIDSSLIKGDFKLPYQMTADDPISAELDYLKWEKTDSDKKYQPDIGDMPSLDISSKLACFDQMDFTDFRLQTRNLSDQFIIDQLNFSNNQVHLKSSGHWQFNQESQEHVSVFNIDIQGEDFGNTVNQLGLGESIKDGKVHFNGQIGWGDSLFKINWPTLIGEVELSLEDGYLLNVDPGAGRFVGLLSLSALPKRLFLDFGDVFNQGMQFNEINGHFRINGEIMNTENASMDSESAKVKISGNTNLRQKTYDQQMFIIPKIGETLPVIGSIAAGNIVGWGLLLLQKIFKKPIEKSVEIEYKVAGSWEQPEITLVSDPESETETNKPIELGNPDK